jgi:hypothetical protein
MSGIDALPIIPPMQSSDVSGPVGPSSRPIHFGADHADTFESQQGAAPEGKKGGIMGFFAMLLAGVAAIFGGRKLLKGRIGQVLSAPFKWIGKLFGRQGAAQAEVKTLLFKDVQWTKTKVANSLGEEVEVLSGVTAKGRPMFLTPTTDGYRLSFLSKKKPGEEISKFIPAERISTETRAILPPKNDPLSNALLGSNPA